MNRQTTKQKPLSLRQAKTALVRLVGEGKVRAAGAKFIDLRELTPREKEMAEKVGRARKHAKAA
jgi:hypothetical protein